MMMMMMMMMVTVETKMNNSNSNYIQFFNLRANLASSEAKCRTMTIKQIQSEAK
jgi:hypothetical protein